MNICLMFPIQFNKKIKKIYLLHTAGITNYISTYQIKTQKQNRERKNSFQLIFIWIYLKFRTILNNS